jgi:acyl-CoA thioesterase-2
MAELGELAISLDLKDTGDGRFVATGEGDGGGFRFAGLLTSMMLTAAERAMPDQELRSIDALFLRAVRTADDADLIVRPLHAGGQLSAVAVAVEQGGRTCAHAQVVLGRRADDLARHGSAMPVVAGPDESEPGYPNHPGESRVVGGTNLALTDQVLPPVMSVWRRAPGIGATAVSPEALLAYDASAYLTGTALLPHAGLGLGGAHKSFTAAITASHMVFHEPIDLEQWVLVHNESTFAGSGWAHGQGQVFAADGGLLLSFTLQGMVRAMAATGGL